MDPTLAAVLGILMRWVHIASVIVLLGGAAYARFVLAPALAHAGPRSPLGGELAARFRVFIFTAIGALLISGLYNFLTKSSYPPRYHMWFGIKVLLALHVFAVALLYGTKPVEEAKRTRWLSGIVISGAAIVAISAYLRWISLSPIVKLP